MCYNIFTVVKRQNKRPTQAGIEVCHKGGNITVQTLEMIEGDMPAKGQALIKEWAAIHKDDLLKIWNTQEFKKLPPLK